MATSITLAYFSTPETQEGSNVAEKTLEIEKKIAKSDLEFTVPKLPNVEPAMLMKPVPISDPVVEDGSGLDGSIPPSPVPTEQP